MRYRHRGLSRLHRVLRASSILALVSCLATHGVLAQQSASATQNAVGSGVIASNNKPDNPDSTDTKSRNDARTDPNMESLLATIRRLEERVKELEAKAEKATADAPAMPVPSKSSDGAKSDAKTVSAERKAEEEKQNASIMSFFRSTEISGFVDAYYGYNFNHPGVDNQLRNFDTKSSQFSLNMAKVVLEKKPDSESRLGFRTDLAFGPATEIVHGSEPGGAEVFKNVQQAYLSYLAPAGKGLQIDVGKFVTPHGAEVIETKDNWNYSRSLLFALAIPYYHFGLRVTYPFSDKFSLSGFVVNGWNNVVDNNTGKTVGLSATVKPSSKLTWVANYMSGPEQTGNNDDWRHLFDSTVTYTLNDKLSLMANYDYGFDRVLGARVHWQGIAGYLHIQANKWFALTPRLEWFDDHDGFSTGVRQSVKDFTITSEHKIGGGLITRLEYRKDFSDKDFFIKPVGRLVQAQSTLTFGLIYAFSSKGE
jgi:hypothetical protein